MQLVPLLILGILLISAPSSGGVIVEKLSDEVASGSPRVDEDLSQADINRILSKANFQKRSAEKVSEMDELDKSLLVYRLSHLSWDVIHQKYPWIGQNEVLNVQKAVKK